MLLREQLIDCAKGIEVVIKGCTVERKSALLFLESRDGSDTFPVPVLVALPVTASDELSDIPNAADLSLDMEDLEDTEEDPEYAPIIVCIAPILSTSLLSISSAS